MNRPEKPPRIIEYSTIRTPTAAFVRGLAGIAFFSLIGCQVVGGLEDLRLVSRAADGGAGSGGNGSTSSSASSSSSVASSSGAPIMGDIACDGEICPVGTESACCSDQFKINSKPFMECVNGPPSDDGCNTAGGANGYETRIECQIPAHCPPGTVCCGNFDTILSVNWYSTLSCTTSCTWPDTVVCDPNSSINDCPVVNIDGKMVQTACTATDLLPLGYAVCK